MSAAWTEEFRQALDRLTERGLSREVTAEIWWAGATRMAADLEAASDDALAEISRLWRASEALARKVAQASQNRHLTASGPGSGQGDHRDDEGRPGARDGSGS